MKFSVSSKALFNLASNVGRVICVRNAIATLIGLSAPYLMEICNAVPGNEIVCHLSEPSRPLVITPQQNAEGEDFLALLMPMHVSED